jgi:hypothetical protein
MPTKTINIKITPSIKKLINNKIEQLRAELTLEYERAHESATFIDEYFNDFKEEMNTIKEEIQSMKNALDEAFNLKSTK